MSTPADVIDEQIRELFVRSHHFEYPWMMSYAERCAILWLLETLRPQCAIEIGTAFGGSLQAISRNSGKVFTFDINAERQDALKDKFENVEFISGDSAKTLPAKLTEIDHLGEPLEFVLIDGDHTYKGALRDINTIARYRPKTTIYGLIHDSFNPAVRKAVLDADWGHSPYVQFVEVDFVSGGMHEQGKFEGWIWGGFALFKLAPEPRAGSVPIYERYHRTYLATYGKSEHRFEFLNKGVLGRLRSRLAAR